MTSIQATYEFCVVNCFQEVVKFIDQNRGRTVIGWYKYGQIYKNAILHVEQEESKNVAGVDFSYHNFNQAKFRNVYE